MNSIKFTEFHNRVCKHKQPYIIFDFEHFMDFNIDNDGYCTLHRYKCAYCDKRVRTVNFESMCDEHNKVCKKCKRRCKYVDIDGICYNHKSNL